MNGRYCGEKPLRESETVKLKLPAGIVFLTLMCKIAKFESRNLDCAKERVVVK